MDKPALVEVQKGEVSLDIKVEDGKVKLAVGYDGKGADAKVEIAVDAEYFGQKLKDAIPGQIDDVVIDLIVAASKK